MNASNTNLSGVDVVKLFAAVMVLALHSNETYNEYVPSMFTHVFCQLAVPFFFLSSGYLFAMGLENTVPCTRLKTSVVKLVKLYAFWGFLILGPFMVYDYFTMPKYEDADSLYIALILFRRFFVAGVGPYWYLLALLLCFLCIYPLRNKIRILAVVAVLSICLSICYDSYRRELATTVPMEALFTCFDFLYSCKNNFIMLGLPFTIAGYLIRKLKFHVSARTAWLCVILFTVIITAEFMFQNDFPRKSIAYIFQSVCLFFAALSWNINIPKERAKQVRALSSFIYFSHWMVLYYIVKPIVSSVFDLYPWTSASIVPKFIFSLAICVVLYFTFSRCKHPFVKFVTNG